MTIRDEDQKKLAVETHSEQAELFADRYLSIADDPYANVFRYSRYRLDKWLDELIPRDGSGFRLLDLGCGTGYHMANYRKRGFEAVGVDGSEDMIAQARQLNPDISFYQADVEDLPLDDDSFDVLLSIEVIRYLPKVERYLAEACRVLRPGGHALITAAPPLQANLYPIVNRLTSSRKVGSLTNLKQYFHGRGLLEAKFKEAGFKGISIHGVYGGPFVWVERILPSMIPPLLRSWEKVDTLTADAPVMRHFSNMFLVSAFK